MKNEIDPIVSYWYAYLDKGQLTITHDYTVLMQYCPVIV